MSGTATTRAPIWPRVDDRTCAAAPAWFCVVQRSSHHTPRPPASPTVAAVPTRRPRKFGAVDGRRRPAPPIRDKALQPAPARGAIGGSELLGSFYTRPTPSASQGTARVRAEDERSQEEEAEEGEEEQPMRRPVSNSRRPGADRASPGVVLGSRLGLRPVTALTKWNAVWEPTTSRINPMVAGLSTRQS